MAEGETRRLPPGLALAWGAVPERRRGPRPGHTVNEIVQASLALADTGGVAGLSMPRVAAAMGLTQNALYRYVASKEELLVLLADAGYGRPPELPARWQEAAASWTRALLHAFRTRPWLLDLPIRGAPRTPGPLRWTEVLLQALATTALGGREQLGLVMMLDGYARNAASLTRDLEVSDEPDVQSAEVQEFLLPRLREGGFPIVASLMLSGGYDDAEGVGQAQVEFGLARILDGVESMLERRNRPPR